MADSNYWQRWSQSRLTRRRFLAGAATLGAGALAYTMVGCRESRPSGTPAAQETPAGPTRGGVVRAVLLGGNVFDSVDVHRAFGDPTSWLSNYVLNKIVRYKNPDTGEIEGDLAERFEIIDGANYVFHIRRDVYWQDTPITGGRQLTAEDIRWHIERQKAGRLSDGSQASFRHQSFYQQVVRVETPDQFTVRVTLQNPRGTFLDRLANYFSTVPNREATERFEKNHTVITEEAMPATGAFILRRWRSGEEIRFERNPKYFRQGRPYVDGWIYPTGLFEDTNAWRIAFEQKQVDTFYSSDPNLPKSIIDSRPGQMYEVLTGVGNTVFMHLNMNQQFKDVRLVKALHMAFDRRAAIQAFHQGLGQVSGPVPWLQEGFAIPPGDLANLDGYRTNRDEDIRNARQLWQAAGGPALGEINIKVPDTWLAVWPDTVQIIPNMLNQALGVNQFRSTRTSYNEEIIPNLFNGQFPNWFGWTSQVTGPDPRETLFSVFHPSGSQNFQKVNNPELTRLLEAAIAETDYRRAVDLVRQIQRILIDNGQYGNVVLYNYILRTAVWNYFRGALKQPPRPGEPALGYNIFAGHLTADEMWLNSNDPTFQGRANVSL
ncbi:MAG: ABC transporter substrate-binding protein [Dehalococcoidia bacterium]|nr:ABC transporter substrate-binding protein [Dehalococcoidia bacterium]MDW8008654.1 ABC transporter substrate-binding protein [Chloroflexota bacterium]